MTDAQLAAEITALEPGIAEAAGRRTPVREVAGAMLCEMTPEPS